VSDLGREREGNPDRLFETDFGSGFFLSVDARRSRAPQAARAVSEATSSIQRVWFSGGMLMARSYRRFAAYALAAGHEVNLGTGPATIPR
jgi:hypothetical protein